MKLLKYILIMAVTAVIFQSCIEDGVSSSSSDQPTFSVDSLKLGTVFTEQGSTTHRFLVYNRHDKIININSIELRDKTQGVFRLNVDGQSGSEFHNVEIRPNDSIYVFVEATLPPNGKIGPMTIDNTLDFTTLGVTRSVVITADGLDVIRLKAKTIETDTRLTAERPYQVFDSLVVAPGATLTIDPGAHLYFHDKSELIVRGSLRANGTPENPVNMTGDRTGNVVASIPFELMSGQWGGVYFATSSSASKMTNTSIRNMSYGVVVDSVVTSTPDNPALYLLNCQIHNSAGYILQTAHSAVTAIGTELTDAANGIVYVRGGNLTLNHCTIANYYLFSALGGPALQLDHINAETDDLSGLPKLQADITNTIIYGNGTDISHGDLTDTAVTLRRCLLKSAGSDDDNFINCLWDTDPMYYTVREDYLFDYRLKPESPAIQAADPALTLPDAATDPYGTPRLTPPSLGAYEYTPADATSR